MQLLDGFNSVEQILMAKAAQNRVPINGSIELLPLCNMNCDMCYVRLSREEMEKLGRIRTAEEWLGIAKQMQQAGTLFLLLTGGEPLLYPEFKELYLKLKELGMILTINTNGTLINEEWVAFFSENKPRRMNITLYGASEETYRDLCHFPGGFQKVLKGIRLLRENNIDVKISVSVTKNNQDEIDQIIDLGKELDAPVHVDSYMLPAQRERTQPFCMQSRALPEDAARIGMCAMRRERGEEKFGQFRESMLNRLQEMQEGKEYSEGISCHAGKCSYTINWQGEMRPCVIMSNPSMSVFEQGFDAAWKHIAEESDKLLLNKKCSTCSLRPLCRVCVASALCETGEQAGVPEYLCKYAEGAYDFLQKTESSDV